MALLLSGFTWTILIVLGVALFLIIRKMGRAQESSPSPSESEGDLSSLTIREARRGDVITIARAGVDFEDLSFTVSEIHRYEWGRHHWNELIGKVPQGQVALEWDDDEELIVTLTKPGQSYRLDEVGLREEDLIRMDEEQSSSNTVSFQGSTFHYESSHETGFFENEAGQGEGFYLWSFASRDDRHSLSIEKWEGEAFEVSLGDIINPEDITLYRR